jgi:hypothetical protein
MDGTAMSQGVRNERRTLAVVLDEKTASQLQIKATELKVRATQLAAALLKKIVEDDLLTAVLDD